MNRMVGIWAIGVLALSQGCSAAKPILHTTNDAARILCENWFKEREGLSIDDAKTACAVQAVLDPFIRELTRAQETAGAEASGARKAK